MSESPRRSLSVDDAKGIILAAIEPLPAVQVPIADARGRTLAKGVTAGADSPRFPTSAMDGFAIRFSDLASASPERPVHLPISSSIPAGQIGVHALDQGTTSRVMTGAHCPAGTDLVVPVELAEELIRDGQSTISISRSFPKGSNLREVGEDFRVGQELIAAETVLSPALLSLIAGSGGSLVSVRALPRVALITTGDELVAPGEKLDESQIWDTNQVLVGGLIEQFGGIVAAQVQSVDRVDSLSDCLDQAVSAGAELIVTVGGASKGDRDVLSDLAGTGANIRLWDVQMKPGRPLAFGRVSGVPLIGLPGNPAAAFVSAFQFVRPALGRLQGFTNLNTPTVLAQVSGTIENTGGRRNFVRVALQTIDGVLVASPAGPQTSANLLTLSRTDGLLIIPEDRVVVESAAMMSVQLVN